MKGNCHRNPPIVLIFGMTAVSKRPEVNSDDVTCEGIREKSCEDCMYFVTNKERE